MIVAVLGPCFENEIIVSLPVRWAKADFQSVKKKAIFDLVKRLALVGSP